MPPTPPTQPILLAFGIYLAICALSAIYAPVSWLWAAGLTTVVSQELSLVFSVMGAYLLALSIGALIASRKPSAHGGVICLLIISQVLDFIVTVRAVYNGSLPRLPGTIFLVATVVWSTLLSLCWKSCASDATAQHSSGNFSGE
jgi:hypothetical protein